MVARKSFIEPKQGLDYNIQAFYLLKPTPPTDPKDDKMSAEKPGLYSVTNIGRNYYQEVLENKKRRRKRSRNGKKRATRCCWKSKTTRKPNSRKTGLRSSRTKAELPESNIKQACKQNLLNPKAAAGNDPGGFFGRSWAI